MKWLYFQLVLTKKITFSQGVLQVAELRAAMELLEKVDMQNVKTRLLPFILLRQQMS